MEDDERKRRTTAIAVNAKNEMMRLLEPFLQGGYSKEWLEDAERAIEAMRAAGFKQIADELGEYITSPNHPARLAQAILEQTDRDVAELTGDLNSTMLDDWDINDISSAAEFARQIKQNYGVQLIVKPEIHTHEAGRRTDEGYNRAFARIYITRECKPVEAFELYLQEEGISLADEDDRATAWNRFDAAIRRRRRAAK